MTIAEIENKIVLNLGNSTYFNKAELFGYLDNSYWQEQPESIDHITVNHVLEYLSGPQRINFINEIYRVLKPGGKVLIYVPYYSSVNAHADPYLVWPPISEMSMQYLCSAEFRERNNLYYPEMIADFHLNWGVSYDPSWQIRSDLTRTFGIKHYNNISTGLVYTLTKSIPPEPPMEPADTEQDQV